MGIGIHAGGYASPEFKPINEDQKKTLEGCIGESLPNGLEIREVCIPVDIGLFQFRSMAGNSSAPQVEDYKFNLFLRYSPKITPEEKVACEALKQRNSYFRAYFSD